MNHDEDHREHQQRCKVGKQAPDSIDIELRMDPRQSVRRAGTRSINRNPRPARGLQKSEEGHREWGVLRRSRTDRRKGSPASASDHGALARNQAITSLGQSTSLRTDRRTRTFDPAPSRKRGVPRTVLANRNGLHPISLFRLDVPKRFERKSPCEPRARNACFSGELGHGSYNHPRSAIGSSTRPVSGQISGVSPVGICAGDRPFVTPGCPLVVTGDDSVSRRNNNAEPGSSD
jgi:hypothetical protein